MRNLKGKQFFTTKKSIKSLSEYFDHVEESKEILKTEDIWYRGQSSVKYKLTPNIYRINYTSELEEKITSAFRDKAKGFVSWRDLSDYDWYFLMQHYGLKTRLLDWTEGYLIALFFALKIFPGENKHQDSAVWLIDPLTLNKMTINEKTIVRTELDENRNRLSGIAKSYLENNWNDGEHEPIAISSSYSNERILRQKGCFTLHGNSQADILSIFRRHNCNEIIKLIIDAKSRDKITRELLTTGISESTIFPDLEGLSREINFTFIK